MDKSFCKVCKYNLTIRKSDYKTITIHEPIDFIKMNYNESMSYDIYFNRDTLVDFLKNIKKLSKDDKQHKLELYDKLKNLKKQTIKYIYKCLTCGAEYPLQPNTIIYSVNYNKQNFIFDDDDIEFKINDPTLPRTKDYKCANADCETNINNKADKEAVFYRSMNSYHLKYACAICKKSWFV